MSDKRRYAVNLTVCGLLAFVLIIGAVVHYANSESKRTVNQVGREISQITMRSAETVEAYVASAKSHMQLASVGVSNLLMSSDEINPNDILTPYLANAPFSNIEYIQANGMNMTNAGESFDASDREYFKEGIKGNSGIWINYSPKYSEEPLLNFYVPLRANGQIVGVLTGTSGGNSALGKLLISDYLGEVVYGLIVDRDNTIIASTVPFEKGMVLNRSTANIEEAFLDQFFQAINRADGKPVELGGKYNNTICVVEEIENVSWKIIQIAPSTSIHEITSESRKSSVQMIIFVLIVSVVFFLYVLTVTNKLMKFDMHQIIDEEKKREQELFVKSIYDELTGLLNRRAYEERIQEIERDERNDKLIYVSMDVNGLKVINDSLGHEAGDELIRGAAECMKKGLKKYGNVYRTGGDEFVAIMEPDGVELSAIQDEFKEVVSSWKSERIDKIEISCGFVAWKEDLTLSIVEIAKLADKRMYHAKALYYKSKGVDRRGLASAQTALLSRYNKILKINITNDTHTIVSLDETEMVENMGFSEHISTWFEKFAVSGNIYEDDVEEFIAKTNLSYLKEYFNSGKTAIGIHYRRKVNREFKRVIMEMILADDYTADNQSLFLYVREEEF